MSWGELTEVKNLTPDGDIGVCIFAIVCCKLSGAEDLLSWTDEVGEED